MSQTNDSTRLSALAARNIEDVYPLSPLQQGMLFQTLLHQDSGVYLMQDRYRMGGQLDVDAFLDAWRAVVAAHPALRTSFVWKNQKQPLQVVHKAIDDPVEFIDLSDLTPEQQEAFIVDLLEREQRRGFDLAKPPLIRCRLVRLSQESHELVRSFHHILMDAWCISLVMVDFIDAYDALRVGRAPAVRQPRPFREYIAWLQQQDKGAAQSFWQAQLAGFEAPTPLVVEQAPRQNQYREAVLVDDTLIHLNPAQSQTLNRFCQHHRITANTLFQGVWALLLSRYSGQTDVAFGVTVSGRPAELAGVEDMIGLFINTLPLRVRIDEDQELVPWLQALQRLNLELREYEHSALVDIQGWSDLPRGQELFDSILVFENAPFDERLLSGNLSFRLDNMEHSVHTHYGLTVVILPGENLGVRISYDRRRFSRGSIERMLGHIKQLVLAVLAEPFAPLRNLELLTEAERTQLFREWNATDYGFPLEQSYAALFAAKVQAHPERTAAVCGDDSMTYAELDARSSFLATAFIEAGAGPDTLVAVLAERGLGLLCSLIAVFKAGAAYVPLETKHPDQRLLEILSLSGAALLVASDRECLRAVELCKQLPRAPRLFGADAVTGPGPAPRVELRGRPQDLAYVIFTSGSTGRPKGVLVEQRGMLNNIFGKVPALGLNEQDRIAQTASVAFDISVWQCLAGPVLGAEVHFLPDDVSQDPARLIAAIEAGQLTVLEAVPAVIRGLLDHSAPDTRLASLRWLMPTGEALPPALCRDWFARFPHIPMLNAYGPAECSDDVAVYAIAKAPEGETQAMPIGRPTPNNHLFIVDDGLRPVPVGVPGEICVAGAGVGRGYLNDPERTSAAFAPHPFAPAGERFYRTGDLGRYRADGVIEFLGRRDQQVKIRGHRIELGEIEAKLEQHPAVREAAVVARPDARGELQLVAYWVKTPGGEAAAVREALRQELPAYMLPAQWVELDALPLNPNGKVDRKQLADRPLAWMGTAPAMAAPRTPTEAALYPIWAEVLGVAQFGVDDDFFSLGGHSLLATYVISRIRAAFTVELPLKALFEHPTVAQLAAVIASCAAAPAAMPTIAQQSRPARIPLSFAQQRLWFVEQLNPGSSQFNVPIAIRLLGAVDPIILEGSFSRLLERHEVLRTAFGVEDGVPCQRIEARVSFELPVLDYRALSTSGREQTIKSLLREEFDRPFDLGRAPLLRARLIQLPDQEHLLALTLHHLVSDGWSATLVLRELAEAYAALQGGRAPEWPALPIQYADFALWQRRFMQGAELERQLTYWKKAVSPRDGSDTDYLITLPTDRPRPAVQSYASGLLSVKLSSELSDRVRAFASRQKQSPFSLVFAAFAALLHRMSGQHHLVLGTPMSNRRLAETEHMLGILLNNLAIATDFSADPTFAQLARQVSDSLLEAQEHQDLPFEHLVDQLALPRSLSHAPLFQVMVAQQLNVEERVHFPGMTFEVLPTDLNHSEYDLDLHIVAPVTGPFELGLMYAHDLFEQTTAEGWLDRFVVLLERLLDNPAQRVAALPLLTESEWRHWVLDQNRTDAGFPHELTVHRAFEQQVVRSPEAVAAVFQGQQLTYLQLNEKANRLAHYLRARGVGADTRVALCVERSLDIFIGILAILKAGGAYVPLDPAYPRDRIGYVLSDAEPALLLTQQPLLAKFPTTAVPVFCFDRDDRHLAELPAQNPVALARPDNLAYVIYTSGSTGRPKGTLIAHRSVINLAWARIHGIYRPLGVGTLRASFNYSFAFDASVAELILLLDGHSLYITPEEVRFNPTELVRFFNETRLDTFECTPAQLKYLIESGEVQHLPRYVLFGGDAIDPSLWQRLLRIPDTVFFNTYGPTECTVDAIACRIEPKLAKPVIGRPIANVRAYILDKALNPLPPGVAGELHIGGEGVGGGYFNRPELTAEKFIPDPFFGGRMYKTGDLTRWLPDGNIEYLGRMDHQVKIRGFRVELGEIETALTRLPDVREAVVLVREDRPGDQRLVAYIVPATVVPDTTVVPVPVTAQLRVDELREALKQQLPDYMIPNHLLFLDALPLTDNGKIDRKALPAPDFAETATDVAPLQGAVECQLAELWAEVLNVPAARVGRDSNFFHLGGHSLLATVLFARIAQRFGCSPALRQLFERPTLAKLAEVIPAEHDSSMNRTQTGTIFNGPRPDRLPLSFAQQRLWFLEQLRPGTGEYNITCAIAFTGPLQVEPLRQALEAVIERHEILRSRILVSADGAELCVNVPTRFELPVEVATVSDAEWPDYQQRIAEAEARQPFDLTADSPIRARLLQRIEPQRVDPQQALLLLSLHHVVADDWSVQILVNEVAEGYRARLERRPAQLPRLPLQYPDYSLWQRQSPQQAHFAEQLQYWRETLEDGDYLLDLPTDSVRSAEVTAAGGACFAELPHELAAGVRQLAAHQGATPYMVLLAVLKLFLGRYANQRDLRIGTPVANRSLAATQGLIGCFVNTLVIRSRLVPEQTFAEYLAQVKHQVLAAQEHQDVPFDQVVEALAPRRDLHRSPLFQVMFVLQSADVQRAQWPELEVREIPFATPAAKFDLNWEVHDAQGTYSVMLEYRANLYRETTMRRWLAEWQRLLAEVVADPVQPLSRLSPLAAEDRERQLIAWNATAKPFPAPHTLAAALTSPVEHSPAAPALVFEDAVLSYRELHQRANQLAHALREQGVGRDTVIGVCMTRSVEMVVALLGIIKAGGAYLPLDPELPAARLAFMLADAEVSLVLTQTSWRPRLPATISVWCLDDGFSLGYTSLGYTTAAPPLVNEPGDLAYVIYTSGSTGQPKGVLNEHGALLNRLYWMQDTFPIGPHDRVLQKTPYSFDVSVWEFFWPLMTGACLVLAKPGGHQDSGYLIELIRKEHITTLHFVPSMLQAFVAEPTLPECTSLRQVFTSGEALPWELQQRFCNRHPASLINLYGPTEAAIDVSWWRCDRTSPLGFVPIGRPIANLQLYILDDDLQPLPIGAIGELYIGGVGLARGYLNRPELTRERFISNPFQPGGRLYRTGDRCRFWDDGTIQYLGRVDHQVKLRGFRIELGEIDAELRRQPDVEDAVTVLRDDLGSPALVAYVVTAAAHLERIKTGLSRTLPPYMVPALWVALAQLPLNSNGKLDRKQLPKPELALEPALLEQPQGPIEAALAELWAEILALPPADLGRSSHFFQLGGHSLLATVLLARMRERFEFAPALRQVFEQPTLAQLAALTGPLRQTPAALTITGKRPARLPLSFAQQRLWFLEQLDRETAEYNITTAIVFHGELRQDWLQQSLERVVARHEVLRSRMLEQGDGAELVIDESAAVALAAEDMEGNDAEWETAMRAAAQREASRPFDLSVDRLLRARILQRRGAPEALLVITLHHTVADDWSLQLLLDELAECYSALARAEEPRLPPLPVQYPDYSLWQRSPAQITRYDRQLEYWRAELEDGDYVLDLPTDRPRNAELDAAAGSHCLQLSEELSACLRNYATQQGVTSFVLLLAVTQLLLGRLAGQRDVRIGTAVANRGLAETQSLIGCFVNTLVIRVDLDPLLSVAEFLVRGRQQVLAAQEHQDVPFEQVVDALTTQRDLAQTPLFQVMLTMQNTLLDKRAWPGLDLRELPTGATTAKFDLDWDIHDNQRQFSVRLEYRSALFDAATVARWLELWQRLLEQIVEKPGARVSELEWLSPDERQRLVYDWNRTKHEFPLQKTYAQLFAEQVARHPERIAAVCRSDSLTYRELDARASRLAGALVNAGAKPDTLVALLAERGLPLLTMMVAVFKAGAAYLPLDINHPTERLRELLAQSGAPIVLVAESASALLDRLLTDLPTQPQALLTEAVWFQGQVPELPAPGRPQDLAYVIFTSGSTGTPKGAMVEQRGMLNNIFGKVPTLGLDESDRIAQTASPAFDISVWQFLAAPLVGACVHILPDEIARDPGRLLLAIEREGLTLLEAVPTVIRGMLAEATAEVSLKSLRWLLPTGEALPPELCRAWFARFSHVPMMNAYGPAECSDDVAFHPIRAYGTETGGAMPIGRPTANNRLFLLDGELQLVPVGVPGEICVAGVGVGRGYWQDSAKTQAAFVEHPLAPGGHLYRTGDIGRYRVDGTIEFLGRRDHQVKIRGHRIELGEIEARLAALPEVREAALIARRDSRGENQLVAYWVPLETAPEESRLRDALIAQLPPYMVPAVFVRLAQLPLNANGKIDRKALAAREVESRSERTLIAPRTDNERILCELLQGLLQLQQVSVDDNFFALGGDSILGLQLIARARAQGLALSPKQLFQQRTLADLALVAGKAGQMEAEQGILHGELPLLPIQYWLFEQQVDHPDYWNQSLLLTPGLHLDADKVRHTLGALIQHHDALRLRFTRGPDGWHQSYGPCDGALAFAHITSQEGDSLKECLAPFAVGLNIGAGPLVQAVLVELPAGEQRLYLAIHHLAIDGVSWRILLEDFSRLYGRDTAEGSGVPAKTSSYRQWAERIHRYAGSATLSAQRAFWAAQRGGSSLPVDAPAASNLSGDEICLIEKLSPQETSQLLQEVQLAYRTQVPELLLTALVQTLGEWKGDYALTIALEGHGREDLFPELDLSRTVGWFTSLFPVCLRLAAPADPGASIRSVKEQLRAVPERGLGYGVLRYLAGAALPALEPEVLFNYLGRFESTPEAGLLAISADPMPPDRHARNHLGHELEIVPMVIDGVLQVEWRFSGARHQRSTQQRLLDLYLERVRALIHHCLDPLAGSFTPSDFPLAKKLNQSALDKLLGKLHGGKT